MVMPWGGGWGLGVWGGGREITPESRSRALPCFVALVHCCPHGFQELLAGGIRKHLVDSRHAGGGGV